MDSVIPTKFPKDDSAVSLLLPMTVEAETLSRRSSSLDTPRLLPLRPSSPAQTLPLPVTAQLGSLPHLPAPRALLRNVKSVTLDSPALLVALYFALNLGITVYNKVILQFFHFKFPWLLTAFHSAFSYAGCFLLIKVLKTVTPQQSLSKPKDQLIVLLFSFLYTANIAFSTISMSMVSLAFHQIVRSMNPVVTLGMEFLFLGKWRQGVPSDIVSSLGVIIFGVGLATLGDYEFTLAGFLMTFLGTILSALKGITTHTLLAGNGLQFHPIELIWRMSGLSFLQCLYMSYTNGEVDRFLSLIEKLHAGQLKNQGNSEATSFWLNPTWLYVALAVNGIMAFFVNYVSFSANKKVGALSIAVAGNVKQVMILVISVWVFGFSIALVNGCGIFMTLVGGAWYSMIGVAAKKAKKQLA